MTQIPPVIWAQRKDKIFITYCVENISNVEIDIEENIVKFSGVSKDKKEYKLDINLYNSINPEKSVKNIKDRNIELTLKKKEDDVTFWPHLTKEKIKYHWLKVDFEKWIDEDEEEEEEGGFSNFNDDMLNGLGGMGGMPGMEGLGGMGGDFDFNPGEDEPDSDDEDLPAGEEDDEKKPEESKPE